MHYRNWTNAHPSIKFPQIENKFVKWTTVTENQHWTTISSSYGLNLRDPQTTQYINAETIRELKRFLSFEDISHI